MFPTIFELSSIFFNEQECLKFLFDKGILYKDRLCPKCRIKMFLEGELWRCRKRGCRRTVSIYDKAFFSGYKLKPNEILLLTYLWLAGDTRNQIMKKTGHSENTVTDYLNVFRDLVAGYVNDCDQMIGGDDIIVEIDESKFGKRKYNKGHRVEGVWVFGGVERTPERRMFACAVPDRSEKTLLDIIRRFVKPESRIFSDCWAAYNNAKKKLRLDHQTVNHSKHFKDPGSGMHTNTIEGNWNGIKMTISPRNRTADHIDDHLHEFIWRRQNSEDLWGAFIQCLVDSEFF